MKLFSLALIILLCSAIPIFGQYTTINYQLEKNYFNEGQALPAEKPLMFTGMVPTGIDIIEISIFPAKAKKDKDRLYLASWKDIDQDNNTNYSLAVNYKLRASEQYDFRFDFYQKLSAREQEQLSDRILDQITAYVDANISLKGNNLVLNKSEKKMTQELEDIIRTALEDYRNQNGIGFEGLSETVRQKLDKIESLKLNQQLADKINTEAGGQQREVIYRQQLEELEKAVVADIRETMSTPWSKLSLSRYVDDYETEHKKGSFSISAGYGGVYLNGDLDQLTYGAAPYLGVAFPLSNSTIAPKFLRNSSIVLGAFLENFEDESGNKISGLIVDRPIYLGLDYKLFEFIRFNAGAALLEKTEAVTGGSEAGAANKTTLIRPFVGLSARIDLTVGFGK
ncbi:hypothetical protein [Flavilitoribacter nigricans]|uniref:Uncharacterized protein n=1 Tax=Flavilitoribacter nigricans (strain ATCC 23147 / DSM 23189 / NBRC 102662 / NCIMB 1420 / SS-2) TaxID=1122177 RepID=A0A2D0N7N8_FLAN2|nr:hypothetical protein [Flavilitoribacter nigricans]PHN04487.1 hypothetical protein CRP01_20985 [Flavilitoribacter nigricans DSM 23189 = NBRC 102662]